MSLLACVPPLPVSFWFCQADCDMIRIIKVHIKVEQSMIYDSKEQAKANASTCKVSVSKQLSK
jgi:hypothetical protein